MSNRDARPLPEKAMSAMHDAAIEEIHQGKERWGIPVLVGLHTGFRRRIVSHLADDWRSIENGQDVLQTPKRIECNIKEDGCSDCNASHTGGPDGILIPKTGNSEQRTVPIFETWYDRHLDEKRDTELGKWLDHWFRSNDAGWGYEASHLSKIIKLVAKRRHDTIADSHQGEEQFTYAGERITAPDIIYHDLRATWATYCLKNGVKDQTIQDWGGWETRDMLEHYRGFIGDPDGEGRDNYENDPGVEKGEDENVDMGAVMTVYSRITDGKPVNASEYSQGVLSKAYEMVEAS
jgi:integrase